MPRFVMLARDEVLVRRVSLTLRDPGYALGAAADGRALHAMTREEMPELVLLDARHPHAVDCLRLARKSGWERVPVILVGAERLHLSDAAHGAVDAELPIDFSGDALREEVFRLLGRERRLVRVDRYAQGGLELDFLSGRFAKYGLPLSLSEVEVRLLRLLIQYQGITLSHAAIIERVWRGEAVGRNTLAVTVKRLRDKLEDNPTAPRLILTVYGEGYLWRDAHGLADWASIRYNGRSLQAKGK